MNMKPLTAWGTLAIQLGGLLLATIISLTALHSARESERARIASEQAREEASRGSRVLVCSMIISQDEVLNDPEDPPPTDRARKNAAAWRELRNRWC